MRLFFVSQLAEWCFLLLTYSINSNDLGPLNTVLFYYFSQNNTKMITFFSIKMYMIKYHKFIYILIFKKIFSLFYHKKALEMTKNAKTDLFLGTLIHRSSIEPMSEWVWCIRVLNYEETELSFGKLYTFSTKTCLLYLLVTNLQVNNVFYIRRVWSVMALV